ncbi:MAG: efflux RND transporter periplasmic adaptor subunit [Deltaproteobacteria bacterium]|nr:efflux RND transporter periplasmic adaptor subunit [Deltaproteobacteria bacterium]
MADQLSNDLAALRIDRGAPPPERSGAPRFLLGLGLLAGLAYGAFTLARPALEARFFRTEVGITELALVSPAQAAIELSSTGYVVPQVVTLVGAKTPGRVAKVNVREGDAVTAGQELVVLDSADIDAQKRAAESRVAAAAARVAAAEAALAEVGVQLERETRLSAEGISPKSAAENLTARAKAQAANVKAAQAEVASAQAEVRTIAVGRDYLTIRTPIDGRVVSKPPQLGELVGALTLTPLTIEIADMQTLAVETDVPEARLEQVRPKAPTEIVLDAFPSRRFRGEVLEVSPKVNRQKATVRVKVRFVDPTDAVLPEMAARVSFLSAPLDEQTLKVKPKLVVPAGALAERAGGKVVFVIESDRVKVVPVTIGAPFGGGFEVTAGPPAGTRVVRDPPPSLADGQRIKERGQG